MHKCRPSRKFFSPKKLAPPRLQRKYAMGEQKTKHNYVEEKRGEKINARSVPISSLHKGSGKTNAAQASHLSRFVL